MSYSTIQTAEYQLNGRKITYKGRGNFEITSQEDMAALITGENGAIVKYASVGEKFTVELPVIYGSDDDAFLQNIFNNKQAVTGYVQKPLLSVTTNSLRFVKYDISIGIIQRSPSQTDNITIGDAEAESAAIFTITFTGRRTVI